MKISKKVIERALSYDICMMLCVDEFHLNEWKWNELNE